MTDARNPWTTPALRCLSVGLDTATELGSNSDGDGSTTKQPG